jgi:polysaccharide export outer membrane protein
LKHLFQQTIVTTLSAFSLSWFLLFAGEPVAAQDSYILKAGDRIGVSVMEDPVMDQTSLIRPDGRISIPIAGSVTAAGETPEELQRKIANRLSSTFTFTPTVTVSLLATAEDVIEPEDVPFIYILGQVANPGRIEMAKPITLVQALAVAGGPGPFAATRKIFVRRTGQSEEVATTFDYEAFEDGGSLVGDILLQDGDVIVVPERGLFD